MACHVLLFNMVPVASCSILQFQQLLFVSMITTGMLGVLAFMGLTYKGWIAPISKKKFILFHLFHLIPYLNLLFWG